MTFLPPIKNLVFLIPLVSLGPCVGHILMWVGAPLLSICWGQTESNLSRITAGRLSNTLSMVSIMRCPLLSKLCSPNYPTLENEILTFFLSLFLLLLGKVW